MGMNFIFIPISFQEKYFIPNSFIFIPILFQEKIFIPNSFIFIPILFEEKIFIPNSFQYSIFCILHFMPILFLYYPFYAQFIPNISAWIYSMSIFMPILFRRKHDIEKNENGMKWEWIWNEFHVLFQFYSNQKYSFL